LNEKALLEREVQIELSKSEKRIKS